MFSRCDILLVPVLRWFAYEEKKEKGDVVVLLEPKAFHGHGLNDDPSCQVVDRLLGVKFLDPNHTDPIDGLSCLHIELFEDVLLGRMLILKVKKLSMHQKCNPLRAGQQVVGRQDVADTSRIHEFLRMNPLNSPNRRSLRI
uniref:Uncharacterized protein n=1 Tax=Solanum tuberosum TaxID=4113 RepID=M1DHH6_SOLTU